ncbi:tetratricopeptide repeat protein [Streptomyces sp. NPDC049099]|uniref:tetratricopeptide repeat protein n=1 Tax=Streptomyces sp. NPDC049099 TaxID=3155768 RepID=UPI00344AB92C
MDNRVCVPGTSLPVEPPPRRSRRWPRRVLATALAGGVATGAVLTLLTEEQPHGAGRPPAAGPPAQAQAQAAQALKAVTWGLPAALPQLGALIGQQEQRVREQPKDARAWAVLGAAYVARARRTADPADYPRAEQALQTSLRVRAAQNTEALDGLTALALARRDFPAAKRYGEQALKAAPKRWTAYPPLIDAYTGLGDYKNARATLDKLLGLRTGAAARPAVMARASAVYRDRGWREDAVAQLTDAASAAGTPAEQAAYLTGLGQLAWERGDLQDALRHFEAAARLDPDQGAALTGRGRVLAALGRTTEAYAAYRAALAGHPSPQDACELGELYEAHGMAAQAREQYDRVKELVRRRMAAGVDEELLIGQFEADHGDPEEAVERLQAEWERQPGIEVADALGWALHRAGDDEEALTYATTATDTTKGGGVRSALYAFHRGLIELELDEQASARRHLQQALRFNPYFSPLQVPVAEEALRALGDVPDEPPPSA